MFVFGKASKAHLEGLHPNLVKVLNRAIQISSIDFTIVESTRSDVQCYINFGKGRTANECAAGKCPARYSRPFDNKVTWVKHALDSNHHVKSDGFGHAADLYPYPVSLVMGKTEKVYLPYFTSIAKAMFEASKELGIPIRWGANWDMDTKPHERGETDNPHFELK